MALKVQSVCEAVGAMRGICYLCVFKLASASILFSHYGNDFVMVGQRFACCWFIEKIRSTFISKDSGIIGPRRWGKNSNTILHRVLRWIDPGGPGGERVEYDVDLRHVLFVQLDFKAMSSSVVTLFQKMGSRLRSSCRCRSQRLASSGVR